MKIDKNIKPLIYHAIQALVGGDLATSNGGSFEATKYHSGQTPHSKEDAEKKLEEMTILWNRANSYPDLENQLDMQYWDAVNGTKKWQEAVAKVKTDNPKPE